eukprot:11198073-Alexandrium_andersonii.AAC.1
MPYTEQFPFDLCMQKCVCKLVCSVGLWRFWAIQFSSFQHRRGRNKQLDVAYKMLGAAWAGQQLCLAFGVPLNGPRTCKCKRWPLGAQPVLAKVTVDACCNSHVPHPSRCDALKRAAR